MKKNRKNDNDLHKNNVPNELKNSRKKISKKKLVVSIVLLLLTLSLAITGAILVSFYFETLSWVLLGLSVVPVIVLGIIWGVGWDF